MYSLQPKDNVLIQNALSKTEIEDIYQIISESQKDRFIEDFKKFIQSYVDERREFRESFGLINDSQEFRKIYRELYMISLRALSSYFGVLCGSIKDGKRKKRVS